MEKDDLIIKYLTNELNVEEREFFEKWLLESKENVFYLNQMREIWYASAIANTSKIFDKEKAYQRFLSRKNVTLAPKSANSKKTNTVLFFRIVAVFVFAVILMASGFWLGSTSLSKLGTVTVEAPLGSQTKAYLPDGTIIWLNAGTTIRYAQSFGIKGRVVELNGEGYFEVAKNENKPFCVRTKGVDVYVLGTKFNIRNYENEAEVRVALLEGNVRVDGDFKEKQVFLSPNQQIILDRQTKNMKISDIRSAYIKDWTQGILFFDEERLSDITKELERIYSVKIVIKDNIDSYRFFGNFILTEQPIQEVLDVLASTNKLKYKIEGKNITISMK